MSLTSTACDVDLDVFTSLMEDADIRPACEHPSHESDKHRHKGDGEWVVTYPPTACGCGVMIRIVCDRWRQFVLSGKLGLTCIHPGYTMTPEEMDLIVFEPLDRK